MQKGYLAFIDVLGFRQNIVSYKSEDYVKSYIEVLEEVVGPKLKNSTFLDYIVFSDSIVITTKASEGEDFISILGACSRLLYSLTTENIPIRGSISYGFFERRNLKESNNIFIAGPALVEAYDLERRQNWIGITLCPSVLEKDYGSLESWSWKKDIPLFKLLYYCHKIPLHTESIDDETLEGYIVFPRPGRQKREGTPCPRFMNSLKYMKASTMETRFRNKYENTIGFFEELHGLSPFEEEKLA